VGNPVESNQKTKPCCIQVQLKVAAQVGIQQGEKMCKEYYERYSNF